MGFDGAVCVFISFHICKVKPFAWERKTRIDPSNNLLDLCVYFASILFVISLCSVFDPFIVLLYLLKVKML